MLVLDRPLNKGKKSTVSLFDKQTGELIAVVGIASTHANGARMSFDADPGRILILRSELLPDGVEVGDVVPS